MSPGEHNHMSSKEDHLSLSLSSSLTLEIMNANQRCYSVLPRAGFHFTRPIQPVMFTCKCPSLNAFFFLNFFFLWCVKTGKTLLVLIRPWGVERVILHWPIFQDEQSFYFYTVLGCFFFSYFTLHLILNCKLRHELDVLERLHISVVLQPGTETLRLFVMNLKKKKNLEVTGELFTGTSERKP